MKFTSSQSLFKYEKLIVGDDSNIGFCYSSSDNNLADFSDLFNLTDLFPSKTRFMKDSKPTTDFLKDKWFNKKDFRSSKIIYWNGVKLLSWNYLDFFKCTFVKVKR